MSDFDEKGCGCCIAGEDATPRVISNRPALPAIAYRVGDYPSFRRAMIERIPRVLGKLTARDATDYGIALLDMWAYLGDILTFYQERIANEAYLRTAIHRESVMRLAALLDYRPSPGAAATTYVAFFLEKAKTLKIPIGLRLSSVPGQNEKAQKFETVESVSVDFALNAVRIHGVPIAVDPFAKGSTGGPLLTSEIALAAGAPVAIFDHHVLELKSVIAAATDGEIANLTWSPPVNRSDFSLLTTRAAAVGRQFALFGGDTPQTTFVHEIINPNNPQTLEVKWKPLTTEFKIAQPSRLPLDRALSDVKAGTRVLVIRTPDGGNEAAVRVATVASAEIKPQAMSTTTAQPLSGYAANTTELTLDLRVSARPAAALQGSVFTLYVVGDDGAIWSRTETSSQWRSSAGTFDEVFAAPGVGVVQLFGRRADGSLWRSSAGSWSLFGTGFDLVTAGSAQGRAYLVVRGTDQRTAIRRQNTNGTWSDWQSLEGHAVDLITAVTNNSGAIEIFVRRSGVGDVWTRRETAPGGGWTAWESIGGLVLDLAAAVSQNGDVEALGRGLDSALWHNRRNLGTGLWSGWSSLGGWIDRMAARRSNAGLIYVYARGADKKLWNKRQTALNSTTWTGWSASGGPDFESLTLASGPSGLLYVFVSTGAEPYAHASGSWGGVGLPMWPIPDRRRVTVFELSGDPLPLASTRYPETIAAGPVTIPLAHLSSIEKGRTIILDDASNIPHTATVSGTSTTDAHLLVSFTPGLTRPLDDATAALYGNIARVTHGETIANEVLGSGNAAARFQTFRVARAPVTFVPQPGARNGVANTLEVRVDGVKWMEADTLHGRGKDDRVFVTRVDEANAMSVQFGGEPGARLTTGRNNVTARYRVGLGVEGNVRAGALSNLSDRPPGLKSAMNFEPAQGGASPEAMSMIRQNAPNTVRTFSRIVSLRDFQDAAREHASVAKARASWTFHDYERVVSLTVAAEGGQPMTDMAMAAITADLDARRDINRPMRVRSHENVPFALIAVLQVRPDHLLEAVQKRAEEAAAKLFAFQNRDLGQPVHLSEMYAVLQVVDGVVAVRITRLRRKSGGPEIGDHIVLLSHEIASLESAADAVLTPQFEIL